MESGNGQIDAPLGRSDYMKNGNNGRVISDEMNISKKKENNDKYQASQELVGEFQVILRVNF